MTQTHYRTTERVRLEETIVGHPVQPPYFSRVILEHIVQDCIQILLSQSLLFPAICLQTVSGFSFENAMHQSDAFLPFFPLISENVLLLVYSLGLIQQSQLIVGLL